MTSLMKASKSIDDMREIAARICRDYLTGAWKNVSAEDIQLKRISGGLSNFLYYVSLPDISENNNTTNSLTPSPKLSTKRLRKDSTQNSLEPREVLLRIYGQTHGEHALETMLTESVVFTLLSERKLGPKLHGIFPGGRIEQYIPARALYNSELSDPKISLKIAEKMAQIHSLNIPVSKEPDWLWNTMSRWLKTAESILDDVKLNRDNINQTETIEICKTDFKKEVEWLKSLIEKSDFPVIFSHNDLQEGNILLKEEISRPNSIELLSNDSEDSADIDGNGFNDIMNSTRENDEAKLVDLVNGNNRKRSISNDEDELCDLDSTRDSVISSSNSETCDPDLIIIDYEYCAYNYRGFDLANHFLEWTFDYRNDQFPYFFHNKEQYPTKKQQIDFITTYLSNYSESENYSPQLDEIDELFDEVKFFTMVSHLFWSMWSIVNVHQEIEFGYWNYAACRLNQYKLTKSEYLRHITSSTEVP